MKNVIQIGFLFAAVGLVGCGRGVNNGEHKTHDAGRAGEQAGDEHENAASGEPKDGEQAPQRGAENASEKAPEAAEGDWSDGDTIPSGKAGVPDIKILQVHANGAGDVCGSGKTATLAYKAMKADGTVIDPGNRPFTFRVGAGQAIEGWDVIVARMRVGDNFTVWLPQDLAYGAKRGDLKFDMELQSVK
jgi:FKBP-type peptidyl-prolyl cis-trans isomerase